MPRILDRLAVLGMALLLVAGEAQAGIAMKVLSAGRNITLEFEGNKLRLHEEGKPLTVVFDGDARRYFEIHDAERTWAVATSDDVIAAGRAFDARVRQHLGSADPEEVRAWIERRNRARSRIEAMKRTRFVPTDSQADLVGYMCDGFEEVVGSEVVAWGCYAQWSKRTFHKDDFVALLRFAEFLNSGLGHVEAAQGLDLRDGPLGRLMRSPGVPLFRLEIKDGGRSAVPWRVLEIVRRPIARERFQPPAGYTALPQPASLALPVKAALPSEPGTPPVGPVSPH